VSIASFLTRTIGAVALAGAISLGVAQAQQQPSTGAVSLARQILDLKGGVNMFDPVVVGVVEHNKNLILQANPTAGTDIETVANQLRKELEPRISEVHTEIARAYASQFTEQELKDLLAFYKTPLGRKVIEGEPKALDEAGNRVEAWADKLAAEVSGRMRAEMKKKGHNLL
jgi:uncharacterized protein